MKYSLFIILFILFNITTTFKCQFDKTIPSKILHIQQQYGNERIMYIDYSMPSTQKRLWILEGDSVLLNTYVSHGINSGKLVATSFSNQNGSHKTSIGLYKTAETYHGKHGYSMRVDGLDSTNNNARSRNIVFHSAEYAEQEFLNTNGYLGRSHGCFATSVYDNNMIIRLSRERGSIKVFVLN
jgi:translation initiation factor IF-1